MAINSNETFKYDFGKLVLIHIESECMQVRIKCRVRMNPNRHSESAEQTIRLAESTGNEK